MMGVTKLWLACYTASEQGEHRNLSLGVKCLFLARGFAGALDLSDSAQKLLEP